MNHKLRKGAALLCSAILAVGVLSACSKNDDKAAEDTVTPPATQSASSSTGASSPSASPIASVSPAASPTASPTEAAEPASPSAKLPATKDFTIQLEGNEEVRTAKLAEGDGYSLYVFEQFSFDAKTNRLTMNVDKNYYVDIQKLPEGYNLDDIKKEAESELGKAGKVQSLEGADVNPSLGGAAFMLLTSGDKLTQEIIVKETGGAGFLFKVHMPQGEPSEGFGPLAFASMGSIANR